VEGVAIDQRDKIARLSELRFDRIKPEMRAEPRAPARPRSSPPRWRTPMIWLVLLVIAGGVFALGLWLGGGSEPVKTAEAAPAAALPVAVQESISASGYVVARREATLAAQVTGQITAIVVEEGDTVRTGQIVARLNPSTARAGLANAQAGVDARSAAITMLSEQRDQAVRVQGNLQQLAERGFARRADLEESEARVAVLSAQMRQAQSERAASRALVQAAAATMDNHAIRAPFDGVVVSVNAQPGEMISPISAGGGFTRTGICTIVDMSSLEVEADVNESYMAQIVRGQAVKIVLDAYSNRDLRGEVLAIVPSADRARATFRVRIRLLDHGGIALPNMAAKVRILTGPPAGAPRTNRTGERV